MIKFQAKIEHDFQSTSLLVTHNGLQWSSIRINDVKKEIPILIEVLANKLIEFNKEEEN